MAGDRGREEGGVTAMGDKRGERDPGEGKCLSRKITTVNAERKMK
jgi:hypothetical protein